MPRIKVDMVKQLPVHQRSRNIKLFKQEITSNANLKFDANNVMKNSHIDSLHNIIIKTVDKLSPIIYKYPKLYNNVMKIAEKILKNQIIKWRISTIEK